jgi:iron complex transport system ATP-binding protein
MTSTTLHAEQVSLDLGGRTVLHAVDLAFAPACLHAMVGPNGAGKSSLMRILAQVLAPSSGRVLMNGRPLAGLSANQRARMVAYLPQDRQAAWPMPVRELVMLGRMPHGATVERATRQDWQAVDQALERTKVSGLAHRCITQLSGGEKARVMLARALATQAPVLLVDEPIAALDPHHQWLMMELLQQEAQAGCLVIAVLHDLSLAARFADRIVMLDQGRVVVQGDSVTVLTAQRLADVFGIAVTLEQDKHGLRLVQTGLVP